MIEIEIEALPSSIHDEKQPDSSLEIERRPTSLSLNFVGKLLRGSKQPETGLSTISLVTVAPSDHESAEDYSESTHISSRSSPEPPALNSSSGSFRSGGFLMSMDLPYDVLIRIFECYVDSAHFLCRVSEVCQSWQVAADSDHLWAQHVLYRPRLFNVPRIRKRKDPPPLNGLPPPAALGGPPQLRPLPPPPVMAAPKKTNQRAKPPPPTTDVKQQVVARCKEIHELKKERERRERMEHLKQGCVNWLRKFKVASGFTMAFVACICVCFFTLLLLLKIDGKATLPIVELFAPLYFALVLSALIICYWLIRTVTMPFRNCQHVSFFTVLLVVDLLVIAFTGMMQAKLSLHFETESSFAEDTKGVGTIVRNSYLASWYYVFAPFVVSLTLIGFSSCFVFFYEESSGYRVREKCSQRYTWLILLPSFCANTFLCLLANYLDHIPSVGRFGPDSSPPYDLSVVFAPLWVYEIIVFTKCLHDLRKAGTRWSQSRGTPDHRASFRQLILVVASLLCFLCLVSSQIALCMGPDAVVAAVFICLLFEVLGVVLLFKYLFSWVR